MRLCHKLNPFCWTKHTVIIVLITFLLLTVPAYISGLSAFATTINPIDASLRIPTIGLSANVTPAILENNSFQTPDRLVASYTNGNKLFLFAHSTTVFKHLNNLQIGDQITYTKNDIVSKYQITNSETLSTKDILMSEILKQANTPTLILMTCAGQKTNGQYPERLLFYATKI